MEKDSINAKFHNLASYLYLTSVTPSRSSWINTHTWRCARFVIVIG